MVHCAAIEGKFERNRKKIWISKLKRKHLPKEENVFVCHHHFEDSCFQRDIRVRYSVTFLYLLVYVKLLFLTLQGLGFLEVK